MVSLLYRCIVSVKQRESFILNLHHILSDILNLHGVFDLVFQVQCIDIISYLIPPNKPTE